MQWALRGETKKNIKFLDSRTFRTADHLIDREKASPDA
jgi:hypothetical protein